MIRIIVVVSFLLGRQSSVSAVPDCGSTLYQQSGTLLPSSNTNGTCQWRIIAGGSEKIVLNITDLNIVKSPNCTLASVEVFDGFWDTSSSLGRFCGSGPLNLILTTSNKMLVSYSSPNNDSSFVATYQSVCGGTLFLQNSTTLKSHEVGLTYPLSKKCLWFIVVPDDYVVRVDFTRFQLEYEESCSYDYVEIFDGLAQNTTLGRFCGTQSPPPVESSSHTLRLTFVSDSSVSDEGFEVDITPIRDFCGHENLNCAHFCTNNNQGCSCGCRDGYELQPDGTNCRTFFGTVLNSTYGTIEFQSGNVESPLRYSWYINAPAGHSITLDFFNFTSDNCDVETLKIFSAVDGVLQGTYCGNLTNQIMNFESNLLEIVFTSSGNDTSAGFFLNYASFPRSCGPNNGNCHHQCRDNNCLCEDGYQLQSNGLDCKAGVCNYEISAPSGEVTSPGYPSNYSHNLNCTWNFRTTPGHTVKINFSVVDIEPENTCNFDYVRLLDGPIGTNLSQLCGRADGTLVQSTSNKLYMIFKTDGTRNGPGFQANYSSVCGGNFTASPEEKYIFSHDRYLLSDYYNGTECTWNIPPLSGYRTKLTIETFQLERTGGSGRCTFDYLEIIDGSSTLGMFCGTTVPREFVSEHAFSIRFKSDGSVSKKGFQIKYQAEK